MPPEGVKLYVIGAAHFIPANNLYQITLLVLMKEAFRALLDYALSGRLPF